MRIAMDYLNNVKSHFENKKKIQHYDHQKSVVINVETKHGFGDNLGDNLCLCQAIKHVLFLGRLSGLMPIGSYKKIPHHNGCKFEVSKFWLFYSIFILVLYVPYILFVYIKRLQCGPESSILNNLEWYVMTFGYVITDIESISSVLAGSILSRQCCQFLQDASIIQGPITEMKSLRKTINIVIKYMFPCMIIVFFSYTYVAWLRIEFYKLEFTNIYCVLLDLPPSVVLRGATLIFPTVQMLIIITITELVVNKFDNLTQTTYLVIDMWKIGPLKLENITQIHRDITASIVELNKYFGLQMLMGITSSLYTTIYYLYRMSTATDDGSYSAGNTHENIHYLLGFLYRSTKLVIYLVLGKKMTTSSLRPMSVLQNSDIINAPILVQEQMQTLMLQWQGKKAMLSGLGVVAIGPWLLAPIVGNVITYLLVALQFKNSNMFGSSGNDTYIESTAF